MSQNQVLSTLYPSCIPIEKILSFWIIVYFILYYCKLFPYNPILLIMISIAFQIISITCQYVFNNEFNTKLIYLILILTIKIICFLLIYEIKITYHDVYFSIIFILTYSLYIFCNNDNILSIYSDLLLHNINGKGRISCIKQTYRSLISYL